MIRLQQPWREAYPIIFAGNPGLRRECILIRMGNWFIIVEENMHYSDNRTWRVSEYQEAGPDRADAVALATRYAKEFKPRHPTFDNGREIFRLPDDCFLVLVQGATSQYHFRVSVAEKVSGR